MGLRQDLIDAEVEAAKIAGSDITEPTPAMIKKAELVTAAIVKFLVQSRFTITDLKAPVILEDFKIPSQAGDVLTSVTTEIMAGGITTVGSPSSQKTTAPVTAKVKDGEGGVSTKPMNINKGIGKLEATGYVYIGEDPDTQNAFDVANRNGQRQHTKVKLLLEDIVRLV